MVREGRMRDRQDRTRRERVGEQRVRGGTVVLRDLDRAGCVDVDDHKPPRLPVARRKRNREETCLAGCADERTDVEERLCDHDAVAYDA